MSWWAAAPAIAVAAAVVLGPGLLATAPLRAGLIARAALAAPVSIALWGVTSVVAGALGLPFAAWQAVPPTLLMLAVCVVVRRSARPGAISPRGPALAWLLPSWAAGAAVIAFVAFPGVQPDRISQTYDNVFHLSAVSAILDGFSGSPLTLRSLIETGGGGLAVYPSGWHLLVAATAQLSGAPVAVAFNAVWLVVAALVWLPGVAWLAQVAVPRRAEAVVPVALVVGALFGAFPYALLAWGTIYPTFLAHALLPAAVALPVLAIRTIAAMRPGPRRTATIWLSAVGTLGVVGALGIAHPRVLPTWVVIGAPFVVWILARGYRRARRRGGRARRVANAWLGSVVSIVALGGAAAFAYAVVGLGLFDEPLADRLEGPQAQAVQTIGAGVVDVLLQRAMTGEGEELTWASPLIAAAVLCGVVAAARDRRTRWIVVSFALVAALFVLAAGSDGAIAKLATGTWYKDRFRLQAAIPVLAVPLATLGILAAARRLARSRIAARRIATALTAAVAATGAAVLALTGTSAATASVFRLPAERAVWEIVSQKQIDFMAGPVAETVPEDQRILGDPWDGSALTQLYAGREPVFPHVNGQWDPHRLSLAWHLEKIEDDPAVCQALDALRVRYVLYDPHEFGGGDPAGNHFPGPHAAVEAGLFDPVATDGDSTLFRIDQCGELAP